MSDRQDRMVTWAWCLGWGMISTLWCVMAAQALGPTFDEPFYLQAGLKNWHDLNHRELLTQGTMPLPAEVQTLPLFLAELALGENPVQDWRAWLPIARLGTLVFWWLLLWSTYHLAARYGGTAAGRFAIALVACEPILLGHASLATTDLAFTACLLTLVLVFLHRREQAGWARRLVLPAVWCMVTLLAKASALLFIPVCLLVVEAERRWREGWRPGWTRAACKPVLWSLRDLALIGLMGGALSLAVCPRSPRGLLFQVRHNLDGHGATFLLGQSSPQGYWYYFAATLVIKLGLPILLLVALMLLWRPRFLMNGALWAAVALLALSPTFRVQIGVRFVLPIAVLAMIGVSAALGRWWAEQEARSHRIGIGGFAMMLLLWSLSSAWLVWPHGICYTNELWGGTGRGYLALSDSNYDWGQGLNDLAKWQRRHPDTRLHVWYFGSDPSVNRPIFHPIGAEDLAHGAELARLCQGGYLAVGASQLYGNSLETPAGRYLRAQQPCDRAATFLIYDFRQPAQASQ